MTYVFYFLTFLFVLVGTLPLFRGKHWMFRVWEFGYIQLTVLQILTLIAGFIWVENKDFWFYLAVFLLFANIIYHIALLIPFTPLYNYFRKRKSDHGKKSDLISIISVNVYQPNSSYKKLVHLVHKYQPDMLLTMESDANWENGIRELEEIYTETIKIPLQNTYGMHLYSRLKLKEKNVNYFTSDDIPSVSAVVETPDGMEFKFYGIHPPPPSPTEEETSKERDGEMMTVAKKVREREREEIVVIGDFNNVAWASSSRRFRKISGLIDPRFGRGLVATFHAKYPFMRIPIDLMYHGERVLINELKRTEHIDSDHFPLFCSFRITQKDAEESTEEADADDLKEMEEDIQEGKEEQGDRPDLD